MLQSALLNLFAWVVLGAHAVAPPAIGRLAPARRRAVLLAMAMSLLALLVLSVLATPIDDAADAGLAFGTRAATVAVIAIGAALLADLIGVVGAGELEPRGWQLLALFGGLAAVGFTWVAELLARGPAGPLPATKLATLGELLLLLATGALLVNLRPWLALVAGLLGLPLLAASLPGAVRQGLAIAGAWPAMVAAGAVLTVSPWLPQRMRRPAAAAGLLVGALVVGVIEHSWRGARIVRDNRPMVEVLP